MQAKVVGTFHAWPAVLNTKPVFLGHKRPYLKVKILYYFSVWQKDSSLFSLLASPKSEPAFKPNAAV